MVLSFVTGCVYVQTQPNGATTTAVVWGRKVFGIVDSAVNSHGSFIYLFLYLFLIVDDVVVLA